MAQTDNAYSRLVTWLKIILPLIALGMLSSIFLVSRSIDPTATLPYSQVELDDRVREPRLTTPRFSGVTSDGATVTLDAADMRPDLANPGRGSAVDMHARMETPDGETTQVRADTGRIDSGAGTYEMQGSVVITNSAGYRVTSRTLSGLLDATALDATGSVVADAPMGRITADEMQLRPDPAVPGQYLLVFKDRVRLVYEPGK
jgi:lipopolysaccharide export system protein LptC